MHVLCTKSGVANWLLMSLNGHCQFKFGGVALASNPGTEEGKRALPLRAWVRG